MVENRRECADNDWDNAGEFVDNDRSASRHAKKARDDYAEMVRRVRAGEGDIIVAWESSRLQRDLEVYVRLRNLCHETGCLLSYNGTVYDMSKRTDRKNTALDAIQSEDEAEAIRDRNLRTVRLNAETGKPHGRILYGYSRRYDSATGELIDQVPHPEQAPIVRRIYADFVGGLTAYTIAKNLRAEGIKTATNKEWSDTGVIALLRRASYNGRRIHQGVDIGEASWPGLVSSLTWHRAQAILQDPKRPSMHDTAAKYLQSGIAACGVCGGTIRTVANDVYPSYICDEKYCAAIRIDVMDAFVEERLVSWLSKPESAEVFRIAALDDDLEAALAEHAELDGELKAARSAAKAGRLTVASLIAVEAGLLPQLAAVDERLRIKTVTPLLEGLLGQPDADERWNGLLLEQQRTVLRAVATIQLNPAEGRGNPRLYPGRIVVRLGPKGAS